MSTILRRPRDQQQPMTNGSTSQKWDIEVHSNPVVDEQVKVLIQIIFTNIIWPILYGVNIMGHVSHIIWTIYLRVVQIKAILFLKSMSSKIYGK